MIWLAATTIIVWILMKFILAVFYVGDEVRMVPDELLVVPRDGK
jgi:hypothetical protein